AAAIEAAGERSAAPRVRDLVRRELKAWDGKSPGLSRAWAELPAAELPGSERAEGRLALLVAKAPYQVTSADVVAFGPERTGDRGLLELVSWASHAAALELGGRMPVRPRREDPPRRGGR
ncbi:carboxymuconolactone decarboxylase family protein, partial [Amycolatopsis mediterranei]